MPRGGIGEYQPFDRRIFGVVKARNNKDHDVAEAPKEYIWYSYEHEPKKKKKKKFDSISNRCIESAWSIYYLDQYLQSSSSEEDGISEYIDHNID